MVFPIETVSTSLNDFELRRSLQRLRKSQRVNHQLNNSTHYTKQRYSLSRPTAQELRGQKESADRAFDRAAAKALDNLTNQEERFKAPFLDAICTIFSQISEKYVLLLQEEIGADKIVDVALVLSAISQVASSMFEGDAEILRKGVERFLKNKDPDFDALKWNLCQNYYIAKRLGMDKTGQLLSTEIFGGSTIYLDTNILIHAVDTSAPLHSSVAAFLHACKQLKINIKICQVTIEELERVVFYYSSVVEKIKDKIPEEMDQSISNEFYEI